MPMQQQPFLEILSAEFNTGEVKTYALSGGYFELLDCPYPVTVRLIGLNGELKGIMRNAEASFYLKGGDYQTITIESPQAQTIRFAFGTSEAGTRRTSGVVQVVDGGRARTMADMAFSGYVSGAAVAAQLAHTQLWNPVGSGLLLVVSQVIISAPMAGTPSIGFNAAALATLAGSPSNKRSGGAVGVAQLRHQTNAAFLTSSTLAGVAVPNDGQFTYEPKEPIVVEPGFGLCAVHSAVNVALRSTFDFYEQAI